MLNELWATREGTNLSRKEIIFVSPCRKKTKIRRSLVCGGGKKSNDSGLFLTSEIGSGRQIKSLSFLPTLDLNLVKSPDPTASPDGAKREVQP